MSALSASLSIDTSSDQTAIAAWCLELSDNLTVAISQQEMLHIDEIREPFKVPLAPPWCDQLILWRDQIVPIFDLSLWADEETGTHKNNDNTMIAIIRIFNPENTLQYGAIKISKAPRLFKFDAATKSVPAETQHTLNPAVQKIALAAFVDDQHQTIAILDTVKLFSNTLCKNA